MQDQKDHLQRLCEQVLLEKDPKRFQTLVDEFNRLLEGKEKRVSKNEDIKLKAA